MQGGGLIHGSLVGHPQAAGLADSDVGNYLSFNAGLFPEVPVDCSCSQRVTCSASSTWVPRPLILAGGRVVKISLGSNTCMALLCLPLPFPGCLPGGWCHFLTISPCWVRRRPLMALVQRIIQVLVT